MALDRLHPPKRAHLGDHVFDQLAREILEGGLEPGSAVPSERILVERFGVSRIIVRHALHQLAEVGLVRVRQGGATIVLDPNEAKDLRVLALFYRLAPQARRPFDVADIIEKQYLQGLSIVEVASRRAERKELERIEAMVIDAGTRRASFNEFEERFWRELAAAGKNRIFKIEVGWWYAVLSDRPVPQEVAEADDATRFVFYQELMRCLVAKDNPVEYYLSVTRTILATVFARAEVLQ